MTTEQQDVQPGRTQLHKCSVPAQILSPVLIEPAVPWKVLSRESICSGALPTYDRRPYSDVITRVGGSLYLIQMNPPIFDHNIRMATLAYLHTLFLNLST
jgi:hypothetical protein